MSVSLNAISTNGTFSGPAVTLDIEKGKEVQIMRALPHCYVIRVNICSGISIDVEVPTDVIN